jgi:hypothetical protein
MESVLLFVALVVSVWVFAMGIAGASDKWESEDQAQVRMRDLILGDEDRPQSGG